MELTRPRTMPLTSHKLQDESEQLSEPKRAHDRQHRARVVRNSATFATLGLFSLYCGVKGILKGFQQSRRFLLRKLVMDVCPVLDSLGVEYWVDFGTLLGAYREKDIILHDNDADVVILNPNWDELIVQLQQRLRHYKVSFVYPSEDPSIRWLRVVCLHGVMDLYGGYFKSGDMVEIPQGHGDLCDAPAKLIFPLTHMDFRGVQVQVPGNVTEMLRYRYGDTFMTPRYMDKGRDSVEQCKFYARLFCMLGRAGLRI